MSMGRETEAERRRSTQAEDATGTVLEELPNLLFRVRLDGGHVVGAAATERHALDFLRLLPGDRVRLRRSPRDATRARILGRAKE